MHAVFADLLLINKLVVYIIILIMCLWITELTSVVCDKKSDFDKSLKDKNVEENDLVKIKTAENNLTINKNKGKHLDNSISKPS